MFHAKHFMGKYFNGNQILNTKDINKNKPEIFIVESLRGDGKSTFFGKKLCDDFYKEGKKFGVIVRNKYEVTSVGEMVEGWVKTLYYPDMKMVTKKEMEGAYTSIWWNGVLCGYGLPLSMSKKIKNHSNRLSEISQLMFDEFQPDDDSYLTNEVQKLISIHTSIARGPNEGIKYVPLYMCCNRYSIFNPYYVEFGITGRLKTDTKILKGNGFVYQFHKNNYIYEKHKNSSFLAAFQEKNMLDVTGDGYLSGDEKIDILNLNTEKKYLCTLAVEGLLYGVYLTYLENRVIIFVTDKPDIHCRRVVGTTYADIVNFQTNNMDEIVFKKKLEYMFVKGNVRFKNPESKDAFIKYVGNKVRVNYS